MTPRRHLGRLRLAGWGKEEESQGGREAVKEGCSKAKVGGAAASRQPASSCSPGSWPRQIVFLDFSDSKTEFILQDVLAT